MKIILFPIENRFTKESYNRYTSSKDPCPACISAHDVLRVHNDKSLKNNS